MAFDIITISPTVSDGGHAAGDVFFNLTSFQIPSRACKLINIFMEVASGGGEDNTKLGVLFFQKNTQPTLGTLNATANISSADFTSNQHIGQQFLSLSDQATSLDLDVLDSVALYYPSSPFMDHTPSTQGTNVDPVVLKGDGSTPTTIFAAGVVHVGAPDFDGTNNVKIHLHVEY